MTKDEALKLALDALEGFIPYLPLKDEAQCNRYDKAITALRLVIDVQNMSSKSTYKEQLETKDEPIAWGMEKDGVILDVICPEEHDRLEGEYTIPLYTAPQRTWVGLTEEEVKEICLANRPYVSDMVVVLEARLKEKNGYD